MVHDCGCQSDVAVPRGLPRGEVQDLHVCVPDCSACTDRIEARPDAGATDVGAGSCQAPAGIVRGVLRGIREPEDCSGEGYRPVDVTDLAVLAGPAP